VENGNLLCPFSPIPLAKAKGGFRVGSFTVASNMNGWKEVSTAENVVLRL
jgi:hypothetical protein